MDVGFFNVLMAFQPAIVGGPDRLAPPPFRDARHDVLISGAGLPPLLFFLSSGFPGSGIKRAGGEPPYLSSETGRGLTALSSPSVG